LSIVHVCSQIPYDDPDKFVAYFSRNYPHLFDFFEFSTPLAIFAVVNPHDFFSTTLQSTFQVMSICNVFSWNFLDAFLIIMSIALTQKFEQVTSRVLVAYNTKVRRKNISKIISTFQAHLKSHWTKIREDYNKISILCKTVNQQISTLIIVSFATNMFFIVAQLYWSLM
jgi:hypothetical protein